MYRNYNEVIIFNSFAILLIKQRDGTIHESLIDVEDVDKIKNHNTCWTACKNRNNKYYIKDSNSLGIHRFILNAKVGEIVDHINHDTLDNRKCNLRIVTPAENAFNRAGSTIHSKTGVRGVQKVRNRYRVLISRKHYGYFSTLDEAESVAGTIYKKLSEIER